MIKILKYPKFLGKEYLQNLKDVLCYTIEDYGTKGLSLLISRDTPNDKVLVVVGDWEGNIIDKKLLSEQPYLTVLSNYVPEMVNIMNLVRVTQAQFYFNSDLFLVDVQTDINKFVGPGMLRDVFSRVFKIPETINIKPLDADMISSISNGDKHIIVKPSRFRMVEKDKTYIPLYVRT